MDVGWRLRRDLAEELAERADEPIEVRVARRHRAPTTPRSASTVRTWSAQSVTARPSGSGREDADVRREQPQAVGLEIEVLDDRRPQPADGVGQSRDASPAQLGRLGGPADAIATLEDECPLAGLREVRRGDERVVAAADDDRVPGAGRHSPSAIRRPSGRGPGAAPSPQSGRSRP